MPRPLLLVPGAACLMLLCLQLLPVSPAAAGEPAGRSGPGAVCPGDNGPQWLVFACRYMTADLWRAAGRPGYTAPDGSHWRPWFYGDEAERGHNLLYEDFGFRRRNEGLLEAMQRTDTLPDEYDPAYVSRYWSLFRYTPWSVHFQRELGCGRRQIANPYALTALPVHRSELLGMGWPAVGDDSSDPTGGFSRRALGSMLDLADGAPAGGGGAVRRGIDVLVRNGGRGAGPAAAGGKLLARLGRGRRDVQAPVRCIRLSLPAGKNR